MQTTFDRVALEQPDIRAADAILRRCVHCGFCTATCPTYRLTGDELDGPRGRIYLIKNLLEDADSTVGKEVAEHLDRCLGCLSCTTTCPSDVDYGALLDIARTRLTAAKPPWSPSRLTRRALIALMVRPGLFGALLRLGSAANRVAPLLPRSLRAMTDLARVATRMPRTRSHKSAQGATRGRVILLQGCVQQAAGAHINAAARRLLSRAGFEVVVSKQSRCCGALPQHLGEAAQARAMARENLLSWKPALYQGCDAILVAASGCSAILGDYAHWFKDDVELADLAAQAAKRASDIGVFLHSLDVDWQRPTDGAPDFAWHAPCSLQHGLRAEHSVLSLLRDAGFVMNSPVDAHLCCGAAGTYNVLQYDLASQLGRDKSCALEAAGGGPVVSANLGCMLQLARYTQRPVLHYLELLDWASGGPTPPALENWPALPQP